MQDAKGNAPVDFSSREISLEDFKNYHANISAVMESDDDFVQSVKRMWGLDENKAPPPPELLEPSFFGNCSQKAPVGGVISKHLIPSAAVSHGDVISWNQEKSQLESANLNKERMKRVCFKFRIDFTIHTSSLFNYVLVPCIYLKFEGCGTS